MAKLYAHLRVPAEASPLQLVFMFLILGSFALPGYGQQTVNYNNGDDDSNSYDTSAPNDPTTLSISTGSATQSGSLTGSGGIIKVGDGVLTLDAVNTYTGDTVVEKGTLDIGMDNAIADISNLVVEMDGTFGLQGKSDTVGTLSGAGNIDLGFNGSLTSNTSSNSSFSGIISGTNGSLTKTGSGTLTLTGTNTYSGGTILNQGILTAYHDGAFGTGLLTVNGGNLKVDDDRRFDNNIRLNNDLNLNLGGSSSYDLVFVGDVDLGGATRVLESNHNHVNQRVYLGGRANAYTANR